jgi:hypothetical protein
VNKDVARSPRGKGFQMMRLGEIEPRASIEGVTLG